MELFLITLTCGFVLPVLLLWPLEYFFPACPEQPRWRCDSRLDVVYWFCTPALRAGLLTLAALPAVLIGLGPVRWFVDGFGPCARQPALAQVAEVVVLGDLIGYWVHREFHRARLWSFHAVHHSSQQLDWLSTVRHHPINDIAMRVAQALPAVLLGFSPQVISWFLPVLAFHAILSHANVRSDFGPLGWVIVSPAFHRWHHTSEREGRDKNFAALLPIWDILFGTYYLPRGRLPTGFGIDDPHFPEHLLGQMRYPFRRARGE
jgi:sterol desaturase/sphingolipid hydroxylase (fatty acid hydroxylase superfamily)